MSSNASPRLSPRQQAALANGFFLLWKGETDKAKRYFNILREKNAFEVLTDIGACPLGDACTGTRVTACVCGQLA
jgi:hypothetical protein